MTHALAPDPFAPLSSDETDTAVGEVVAAGEDLVPVIPVPEDAPAAQFRHRELGEPQVFVDVVLDVLGHPTESAPREGCRSRRSLRSSTVSSSWSFPFVSRSRRLRLHSQTNFAGRRASTRRWSGSTTTLLW